MKQITLGGDPEMMLVDLKSGKIVSSLRVLGKDKHDPIDLGDGIKMYADNVLVECAFPPASQEQIVHHIREVFLRMKAHLGPQYTLFPQASHEYAKEELADKRAWETGCNPNFDVYKEDSNPAAEFTDGNRTGSCHIHIGDDSLMSMNDKAHAVKVLDIFLGCASVVFDRDQTAQKRRLLYGRAGEFRPTPYGVEYRVLGPWALRQPLTTELAYDLVGYALDIIHSGTSLGIMKSIKSLDVQKAINENDIMLAKRILYDAGLPHKLMQRVGMTYPRMTFEQAWGI